MLLEDVRGQNRNFKSGTASFRQSELEKDQDRGSKKVGAWFDSDERESGKNDDICPVIILLEDAMNADDADYPVI